MSLTYFHSTSPNNPNYFQSYKGRTCEPYQRVRVYRNLNKRDRWYSILDPKSRLVLGHSQTILLSNCKFLVSQVVQQRVARTGLKEIHAYVEGVYTGPFYANWQDIYGRFSPGAYQIEYDPMKWTSFVTLPFHHKLYGAGLVLLDDQGVTAHAPQFKESSNARLKSLSQF